MCSFFRSFHLFKYAIRLSLALDNLLVPRKLFARDINFDSNTFVRSNSIAWANVSVLHYTKVVERIGLRYGTVTMKSS